jgi:hypothetical protein
MINKSLPSLLLYFVLSALISCQNKKLPDGPEIEIWPGVVAMKEL